MKSQFFTIAVGLTLIFASETILAQESLGVKDFLIAGHIQNGAKGEKVILSQSLATGGQVKIDSTVLDANKEFKITGHEENRGSFFTVNVADRNQFVLLVEGGENFKISSTEGVSGSKNMLYYNKVDSLMKIFSEKVSVWNNAFEVATEKKDNKKIQEIQAQYMEADQKRIAAIRGMIPAMGTSLVALFAANNFLNPENDLDILKKLANDYEKVIPTPTLAKGFIGQIKRTAGLAVGEPAPDFTLPTPDGKSIALSSLKGKYILLDFWASWCGPCRQENPNVVRMYNKFKEKGFDIYGVSLDKEANAWKKAIEKDGLTWKHGSDLKFWNSDVAQTYGVRAIPATFLLDKEGVIIAKNLRGAALEAKLTELLGQK